MNTILRKRPLNNAFKRFQRLPDFPLMKIVRTTKVQPNWDAQVLNDDQTKPPGGAGEERFSKVLTG
jgi:hypothetical protein